MQLIKEYAASIILLSIIFFSSCQKKFLCPDCEINNPPIANAGPDQTIILPKDSTMLDGNNSSDPDGKIISYKWQMISGPFLSNIIKNDSVKTLVKGLVIGIYQFELNVTDDKGASAKDTVQISVNAGNGINQPPVANAGVDQIITLPVDSALLNGSFSMDPDGTIVSWQWTKVSGPSASNILNSQAPQTISKSLTEGTYQFELKVTDNLGAIGRDTVQVTVNKASLTNHPPIACAGSDQVITLPTNSVNLDGSCSKDTDNNITNYVWTKISGHSSFNITNANATKTQVSDLIQGTYQFELKVTDAGGLFSNDTIQVTVNPVINNNCFLSQTLIGSLSIQRSAVQILQAGNKILFAGGFTTSSSIPPYGASSRVDIYDRSNQSWVTAELSLTRFDMGTTTLGNKIYFAGGDNGNLCSRVDIYDALNNNWSTAELSEPRRAITAVSAGNKVLFAGGRIDKADGLSNRVDIYDQVSGTWSTASLSHPIYSEVPGGIYFFEAVSTGNQIYFITSPNTIDIYDAQTNTWSIHSVSPNQLTQGKIVVIDNKIYFSGAEQRNIRPDYVYANTLEKYDISADRWSSINMSQSRVYMGAIAGDGKVFWAGGFDSTWIVNGEESFRVNGNIEIYDIYSGLHSFHSLPYADWFTKTLKTDSKIFFINPPYTEIYDMINHSWSTCNNFLFQPLAIGNTIYQLGADHFQVWKLDF